VWLTEDDQTYFAIAASNSDAEDQYNILLDEILKQSAKELYNTIFVFVIVRTKSENDSTTILHPSTKKKTFFHKGKE